MTKDRQGRGISWLFGRTRGQRRLDPEEERELILAAQRGDRRALEQLIGANLAYVAKVALQYRGYGVAVDDLMHEGTLGFIEGIRHFDSGRGARLLTYASYWVRKSILDALAGQATLVRLPPRVRVRRRPPLPSGPAAAPRGRRCRSLPVELAHLAYAWRWPTSLDDATDQGWGPDRPLGELLHDESDPDAVSALLVRESQVLVRDCLTELGDQELFVVARRFGLIGDREWSLREVGDALGVTRERARQLELQAKQKLRRAYLRRQRYRAPARAPSPHD